MKKRKPGAPAQTCADAAAACPYSEGDVVMLKSGGHAMTVQYVGTDYVGVIWSDGARLQFEELPYVCLQADAESLPF